MPIQISQEDTRLSFAYAVNGAQNAFTINRDEKNERTDGFMKDAAKVVARIPTNAVLGTVAAIETVVKAILTVLSGILYPVTDSPFNYMKASLSLAGRATVEAFKGIAGYATPAPVVVKEEPVVVVTPPVVETPKEEPLTKTQIAKNIARLAYDNKGTIALGLVVTGLVAYNIGLPALNGLYQGVTTGAITFGSGVKDNVVSTGTGAATLAAYGYNKAATVVDYTASGVSSGVGYLASFVRSNSTNITESVNATVNATVQAVVNATNPTAQAVVNATNSTV